ncbi:hypothetical protein [Muricoccus radiodurans]|uniref:hypothetical protein n=1 Tax=Muricoccus radiodurans TaxID=2231721 RepID=UPI003CEA70D2
MPRIPREAHAAIQKRVGAGEKVAAVAASYDCTPANIYAILAKLRRQESETVDLLAPAPAIPDQVNTPDAELLRAAAPDQATPVTMPASIAPIPPTPPEPSAASVASRPPARSEQPSPHVAEVVSPIAAPASKARGPSSASVAQRVGKAGFALMMRTSDGEDTVNPFRSLDELLSAAKPILRTAARSPEPIWFSIQPVDLDALEDAF